MNYCVPDFEMEDDVSIPSSSLPRSKKRPSMQEDEIMELLWQNGQVVMQSQNQRSNKKSPPFEFQGPADQSAAAREIRSSSSSHQHHQQQSLTDHLFMQEDEMASWLHYPLTDTNFDQDFCADLLYPSSAVTAAPCVTSTTTATTLAAPPPLERVSQVPASALASASRPPIPPSRRNELESTRIQNFVHFSRHKSARAEQSALPSPNSKSVVRESTVVDSNITPAMAPESGASQAMPSNVDCGNMSIAAGANLQSAGISGSSASRDNLAATCEVSVTSSPGGSSASASAEPTTQKAAQAEDRKRKGRELDDTECHSEDVEFESAETKKQTRGSTSAKRSRAAEVHNLSERRRRDRINEKMKALQELIPRCNKSQSDKASMLDEAIEYLKSLQLQVQMMSMGCGMVPMMFPGVQQYMATMGMGIGMGMGIDVGRPMMPFPNVLAGSPLPTPAAAAHLRPRFPMPAFHMAPPAPAPAPDPSRNQPNNQLDAMLNPLAMQCPNQPRLPNFADPFHQYIGLHPMQLQPPQNQSIAQPSFSKPSTSKGADNLENHPSGDMTR